MPAMSTAGSAAQVTASASENSEVLPTAVAVGDQSPEWTSDVSNAAVNVTGTQDREVDKVVRSGVHVVNVVN